MENPSMRSHMLQLLKRSNMYSQELELRVVSAGLEYHAIVAREKERLAQGLPPLDESAERLAKILRTLMEATPSFLAEIVLRGEEIADLRRALAERS